MRVVVIHAFLAIILAGAVFAHGEGSAVDALSCIRIEDIIDAS